MPQSDMDSSEMSASNGLRGRPGRRASTTRGSLPRQSSLTFMGLSLSGPARYRQSSAGGRASARRSMGDNEMESSLQNKLGKPKAAYRRYRVGENVLICCDSHWAALVNRFGFPPGEGTTIDEQSGPYAYVMATVKTVHFDEFAEYYTVKRADTGAEQRADTGTIACFVSLEKDWLFGRNIDICSSLFASRILYSVLFSLLLL